MAFNAYITVTGSKQGAFPGTTTQEIPNAKISKDKHSEVIGCEYRVHASVDPKDGKHKGHRQHEPFRITMEADKNMARYFQALTTGEKLDVELAYIENTPDGTGLRRSITIQLTEGFLHDFRLLTGKQQAESSTTSKGRNEFDSRELIELSFMFEKISINSAPDNGNVMAADSWSKPNQVA